MGFGWQDLTVLAVVVAAILFLLRHFRRMAVSKKPPGCGTCSGCSASRADQAFVPIDPAARRPGP